VITPVVFIVGGLLIVMGCRAVILKLVSPRWPAHVDALMSVTLIAHHGVIAVTFGWLAYELVGLGWGIAVVGVVLMSIFCVWELMKAGAVVLLMRREAMLTRRQRERASEGS
jgi:hypothetical protein